MVPKIFYCLVAAGLIVLFAWLNASAGTTVANAMSLQKNKRPTPLTTRDFFSAPLSSRVFPFFSAINRNIHQLKKVSRVDADQLNPLYFIN